MPQQQWSNSQPYWNNPHQPWGGNAHAPMWQPPVMQVKTTVTVPTTEPPDHPPAKIVVVQAPGSPGQWQQNWYNPGNPYPNSWGPQPMSPIQTQQWGQPNSPPAWGSMSHGMPQQQSWNNQQPHPHMSQSQWSNNRPKHTAAQAWGPQRQSQWNQQNRQAHMRAAWQSNNPTQKRPTWQHGQQQPQRQWQPHHHQQQHVPQAQHGQPQQQQQVPQVQHGQPQQQQIPQAPHGHPQQQQQVPQAPHGQPQQQQQQVPQAPHGQPQQQQEVPQAPHGQPQQQQEVSQATHGQPQPQHHHHHQSHQPQYQQAHTRNNQPQPHQPPQHTNIHPQHKMQNPNIQQGQQEPNHHQGHHTQQSYQQAEYTPTTRDPSVMEPPPAHSYNNHPVAEYRAVPPSRTVEYVTRTETRTAIIRTTTIQPDVPHRDYYIQSQLGPPETVTSDPSVRVQRYLTDASHHPPVWPREHYAVETTAITPHRPHHDPYAPNADAYHPYPTHAQDNKLPQTHDPRARGPENRYHEQQPPAPHHDPSHYHPYHHPDPQQATAPHQNPPPAQPHDVGHRAGSVPVAADPTPRELVHQPHDTGPVPYHVGSPPHDSSAHHASPISHEPGVPPHREQPQPDPHAPHGGHPQPEPHPPYVEPPHSVPHLSHADPSQTEPHPPYGGPPQPGSHPPHGGPPQPEQHPHYVGPHQPEPHLTHGGPPQTVLNELHGGPPQPEPYPPHLPPEQISLQHSLPPEQMSLQHSLPPAQPFGSQTQQMHTDAIITPAKMKYGVTHPDGSITEEVYSLISSRVQRLVSFTTDIINIMRAYIVFDRNRRTFAVRSKRVRDICYAGLLDQDLVDSYKIVVNKTMQVNYPHIEGISKVFFYKEEEQILYSDVLREAGQYVAGSCGKDSVIFRVSRVKNPQTTIGTKVIPGDACPFGPPLRHNYYSVSRCNNGTCPLTYTCNAFYDVCCPDMPVTTNCFSFSVGQLCVTYMPGRRLID